MKYDIKKILTKIDSALYHQHLIDYYEHCLNHLTGNDIDEHLERFRHLINVHCLHIESIKCDILDLLVVLLCESNDSDDSDDDSGTSGRYIGPKSDEDFDIV